MIFAILSINLLLFALVLWNTLAWPKPRFTGESQAATCSILIPARNEEHTLGNCLKAAIQQGREVIEIIVCNDHSEDNTTAVFEGYRKMDSRLRMIDADDLPAGWCGKNFACASLAAEARGDWLLFIDADASLSRNAVSLMLSETRHRNCTFLSCWPGLVLDSVWEKMLMPMLNFVVFTLFPAPLSIRRNDPSLGLAHGACIMVQRKDYLAIGGHQVVFDQIFEDTRLARAWRASGRRGICLDGRELVHVRMYDSLEAIWYGFQKNFYPAFVREFNFWLFLCFHAVCFLLPFAALPFLAAGHTNLWPMGAAAGCVLAARIAQAQRFRYPYWSVLVHPLAEIILIAVGLSSWWKCRRNKGVEWKGRIYQKPASDRNPNKRQSFSNTLKQTVRSDNRE